MDIGGKLSEDLSLFYSVDDVRTLFNWRKPEYQNVCKLMSQQYEGYNLETIKEKQDLLMEIQSVITELKVFNFLTENKSARKLLY